MARAGACRPSGTDQQSASTGRPKADRSLDSGVVCAGLVRGCCDTNDGVVGGRDPRAGAAAAIPKVHRIVLIGKQNACDCTRKRVEHSFAVLQSALEGRSDIAIEQPEVDVDQEAVARYQKLRPIMVLPAISLLDGAESVVDVLQGEVTMEQVLAAMKVPFGN
jgi:hypothetical protein